MFSSNPKFLVIFTILFLTFIFSASLVDGGFPKNAKNCSKDNAKVDEINEAKDGFFEINSNYSETKPIKKRKSEDNKTINNNVLCSKNIDPSLIEDLLYSAEGLSSPNIQCKKCNIQLTSDNTAVIVKCYECVDLPLSKNIPNSGNFTVQYLVYFIEIANYTSSNVPQNGFWLN